MAKEYKSGIAALADATAAKKRYAYNLNANQVPWIAGGYIRDEEANLYLTEPGAKAMLAIDTAQFIARIIDLQPRRL
jgi:hypothetical protein